MARMKGHERRENEWKRSEKKSEKWMKRDLKRLRNGEKHKGIVTCGLPINCLLLTDVPMCC